MPHKLPRHAFTALIIPSDDTRAWFNAQPLLSDVYMSVVAFLNGTANDSETYVQNVFTGFTLANESESYMLNPIEVFLALPEDCQLRFVLSHDGNACYQLVSQVQYEDIVAVSLDRRADLRCIPSQPDNVQLYHLNNRSYIRRPTDAQIASVETAADAYTFESMFMGTNLRPISIQVLPQEQLIETYLKHFGFQAHLASAATSRTGSFFSSTVAYQQNDLETSTCIESESDDDMPTADFSSLRL